MSSLGFDPATVQAWSAIAVAVLTAVLVGVTYAYVVMTKRLADEARRTNDLSARNFERTVLVNAPVLILQAGPKASRDVQAGLVHVSFTVANGGGGVATEIEVDSDWDLPRFEAAIARDLPVGLTATVVPPDDAGPTPIFSSFRFTDAGGTRYEQRVGGSPRLVEP